MTNTIQNDVRELKIDELEKVTGGGTKENAGGGKGAPTETVTFNYAAIEWVYTNQR